MNDKQYDAKDNLHCPVCGSGNVELSDRCVYDLNTVSQSCACLSCNSDWKALYEFNGVDVGDDRLNG